MTAVYLAVIGSDQSRACVEGLVAEKKRINLLVSFFYLREWQKMKAKLTVALPADWRLMLDSGAFSAWNSKKAVDIDTLVEETKREEWHESVCLDVIGDAEGSRRNAQIMRSRGSPAFPVFHYGEPWELLAEYRECFWKVGLSCLFGEPRLMSYRWLEQCYARAWPHPFHSFGWMEEKMLMRFPFHSADAATWMAGPLAWGQWRMFKKAAKHGYRVHTTHHHADLRSEANYYVDLQARLEERWRNELSRFDTSDDRRKEPTSSGSTSSDGSPPEAATTR